MMVSGYYQYEYARLLGFQRSNILYPLYAANISLFNSKYKEFLPIKKLTYPRNILFVGRFEKEKNIPLLIESFQSIKDKKGWQLTLIGNGSLNSKIVDQSKNDPNIIIKDFMQPEKLVEEIKNAGVFCLPSDYEPWGVVIQEFAAAGLPLITSNVCGASSIFLKESYNGYIFNKKDIKGLKDALLRILDKRDHELLLFSERSHRLAQIINPEMYAANFIQFLQ
jgi:glycosyltransferase involved in cell wall biosynthesis